MRPIVQFIVCVSIPLLVGFASGLFTATGIGTWYKELTLPSWNPPNWVFGPVWTFLYILMGISLYIVWRADVSMGIKKPALWFFAIQLILNFFWSVIFFNQHQPGWAFVEILVLAAFILLTIFSFAKINKTAALLLVPYISWVSFAAILNYTIWRLNA